MKAVSTILAATGMVIACGALAPAMADRDDWRRHERREAWQDQRRDNWRDQHRGWGYHRPPPVVVAPPAYSYYTPPPVYGYGYGYGQPGVTFGFTVR